MDYFGSLRLFTFGTNKTCVAVKKGFEFIFIPFQVYFYLANISQPKSINLYFLWLCNFISIEILALSLNLNKTVQIHTLTMLIRKSLWLQFTLMGNKHHHYTIQTPLKTCLRWWKLPVTSGRNQNEMIPSV